MRHTQNQGPARRAGFTLVELIGAMVLLAILMTALAGLLPRFAGRAANRTAALATRDRAWSRQALRRLAEDLVHAQTAELRGNELRLTGRLRREQGHGEFVDQFDETIYRWRTLGKLTALEVEQAGQRQLLCCGQHVIQLAMIEAGREQGGVTFAPTRLTTTTPTPLPLSALMSLELRDARGQALARQLAIRQALDPRLATAARSHP